MKRLQTLLGDYPLTSALKRGEIASDLVVLDFAEYRPINTGFKPMVRENRFDVSEMAIITYLIAKAHQKRMVLLPAVVMGRFQHEYALYNRSKGKLTPADLKGKRVGVRSFTTTTAAWVRGILANDYGVDLNAIHWITFEEPHVAEFVDTSERAPTARRSSTCCWLVNWTPCWGSALMIRDLPRCSPNLSPRPKPGTAAMALRR